jgi:hypothetical protein
MKIKTIPVAREAVKLNNDSAKILLELAQMGHPKAIVRLSKSAFDLNDVSDSMLKRQEPYLGIDAVLLMAYVRAEIAIQ